MGQPGAKLDRRNSASGQVVSWVRPTAPEAPSVDSVVGLLHLIEQVVEGSTICVSCGCLCMPDEVCPGCRARRMSP